jgi:hypothetical protein
VVTILVVGWQEINSNTGYMWRDCSYTQRCIQEYQPVEDIALSFDRKIVCIKYCSCSPVHDNWDSVEWPGDSSDPEEDCVLSLYYSIVFLDTCIYSKPFPESVNFRVRRCRYGGVLPTYMWCECGGTCLLRIVRVAIKAHSHTQDWLVLLNVSPSVGCASLCIPLGNTAARKPLPHLNA